MSEIVTKECERFLNEIEILDIRSKDVCIQDDSVDESNYYSDKDKIDANRQLKIIMPLNMNVINCLRDILQNGKYNFRFTLVQKISNEEQIHAELIEEALLNSKREAEKLAESMGMRIDSMKSAEETSGKWNITGERERGILSLSCVHKEESPFSKSDELGARIINKEAEIVVKWRIV